MSSGFLSLLLSLLCGLQNASTSYKAIFSTPAPLSFFTIRRFFDTWIAVIHCLKPKPCSLCQWSVCATESTCFPSSLSGVLQVQVSTRRQRLALTHAHTHTLHHQLLDRTCLFISVVLFLTQESRELTGNINNTGIAASSKQACFSCNADSRKTEHQDTCLAATAWHRLRWHKS